MGDWGKTPWAVEPFAGDGSSEPTRPIRTDLSDRLVPLACVSLPAPFASFALGATPTLTAVYTDPVTGALADPSVVTAKVRKTDGTVTTYTELSTPAITHPYIGTYVLTLPATDQAGDWFYRFEASGSLVDAAETRFHVLGSAFGAIGSPAPGRWITEASLATEKRLEKVLLPSGVTMDSLIAGATTQLNLATGNRFGTRTVNVRPTRVADGCGCSNWCGCPAAEFWLPPRSSVNSVTVDGVVLSSSFYALYDGRRLVRTDGRAWYCCQALATALGLPGTWSVNYTTTIPIPADLALACRELVIHTAQQVGGKDGRLPGNTESVARRGTALVLNRGQSGRKGGPVEFGIPLVDRAVRAHNPHGLVRRSRVSSPDVLRGAKY